MLDVLDAAAVRRWCATGRAALAAARAEIDELNVYPVPDGDTGTNLLLTMEAVERAVGAAPGGQAATARAMADGALMGARGNSGLILSQLLRGLAEVWEHDGSPAALRQGLARGVELAYAAVARPVEGTLLTVARECAEAVADCDSGLLTVVRTARAAAGSSLERTPTLLPALAAAGVVDAGGRGLCVLLEALEQVVAGDRPPADADARAGDAGADGPEGGDDGGAQPALLVPRERSAVSVAREAGGEGYAYEVQYLLRDTSEQAVAGLRAVLAELGDSLAVVGGPPSSPGLYNVHVHVDDVGAALEAGLDAGRPFQVTVTRFDDQAAGRRDAGPRQGGRTVVAVAPGAGLAALFRQSGAHVVDAGAGRPSTAEVLAPVRAAGAAEVVLLPNDADTQAVAAAAAAVARDEGFSVAVVPTRSSVQGLAALAVADPDRPFEDDVAAMAESAGSTRSGGVTLALREAVTMAGICRPGDVLGLLEGDVVLIGRDVEAVSRELLHRMLGGGGELVTLVAGDAAQSGVVQRLADWVEHTHPAVEVVVYDGGQPHFPLLLGVE